MSKHKFAVGTFVCVMVETAFETVGLVVGHAPWGPTIVVAHDPTAGVDPDTGQDLWVNNFPEEMIKETTDTVPDLSECLKKHISIMVEKCIVDRQDFVEIGVDEQFLPKKNEIIEVVPSGVG